MSTWTGQSALQSLPFSHAHSNTDGGGVAMQGAGQKLHSNGEKDGKSWLWVLKQFVQTQVIVVQVAVISALKCSESQRKIRVDESWDKNQI